MKWFILAACSLLVHFVSGGPVAGCHHMSKRSASDSIPFWLKGNFTDDYKIRYYISDSLWTQLPGTKFHIIKWNLKEQYLVARNDIANPGEGGLYTRIDFRQFKAMEPFEWGYCLKSLPGERRAVRKKKIRRSNPKLLGGFLLRMKRK